MLIIDQIGREIILQKVPKRIVSCVPSISELVFDLGGHNELVGCTKFCIYPDQLRKERTIIGGTKNLRIEEIRSLKPDLILVNKEENVRDQVELLMKEFAVYVSDVKSLEGGIDLIRNTALMLGQREKGEELCDSISEGFQKISESILPADTKKVVYFIWRDPWMTVGGDTFISDILDRAGYENVYVENSRYPQVDLNDIQTKNVDEIFLSSEPYPFVEKDRWALQKEFPQINVRLVDGSMFSWYGSRLEKAISYLKAFDRL